MRQRATQLLLIAGTLWLSWLAMMLVHESGHVIGGFCSGGTVRRMVWYPTVISRTDVQPNPHPVIEVWAGPIWDRVSPRFGFGAVPQPVNLRHARGVFVIAVVVTAIGFVVGNKGL